MSGEVEEGCAAGSPEAASAVAQADNWVQCDRCGKWRRVPETVVDTLEDDSNWFCEDNPDEKHNSCNIPQVEICRPVSLVNVVKYS